MPPLDSASMRGFRVEFAQFRKVYTTGEKIPGNGADFAPRRCWVYDPSLVARGAGEINLSHNTWIHRGVRVLVRPLVHTPVTPNHLTSARLLTGLGAAIAFATGVEAWIEAGAWLFLLSMVFDRADGELARLSGKSSRFGHFYDIITDAVCDTAVLAGIGFGLSQGALGNLAIAMGAIAGISVALIFYLIMRIERDLGPGRGGFGAFAGFDFDDTMVLIPIAMWAGHGETLLVAAVTLAPLAAVLIAANFRRRRMSGRTGDR